MNTSSKLIPSLSPLIKSPKTYFIKTFGCQMNFSDSERIATILEKIGFIPSKTIENAQLVVFNTCGVRQTAENRFIGQIRNLRLKNQHSFVVATGCLAQREDLIKKLKEKIDFFISINSIIDLPFLINQKKSSSILKTPILKKRKNGKPSSYLKIEAKYKNTNEALVPIMTGCNNFCSYCVVPYARGREYSRSFEEIVAEIEKINQKKFQRVLLLGQNVNSYCYQRKNKIFSFAQLIDFLAKSFPLIEFSFLTSHPKDFSIDLIKTIAKYPNISKKIHLPLQSGSNKILKKMNRPYTQENYLALVNKIRKIIPQVKLSTDVIVGFPFETEKDFQETVKVFNQVDFFDAFINKYSPRPQTAAFDLGDPIDWKEKKRREKILRKIIINKKQNKKNSITQ